MSRLAATTALFLATSLVVLAACRPGEPGDDPRTPANSPLPEIHRPGTDKDTTESAGPSFFGKDAG